MLEIPESSTVASQLRDTVRNKTIQNVYVGSSPHKFAFYYKNQPQAYHGLLSGRKIDDAHAIAGQVEIVVEDARIVFADGVNIRYFDAGAKMPEKHQLHIEFEDFTSIVCTVQMYGVLFAFKQGENDNPYYLVAVEKPNPLSAEFDRKYFEGIAAQAKPGLSVKALLATDQRIPGLGNGVLQDILFRAGVNPRTRVGLLSGEDMDRLYNSLKETLFEMTAGGGRDTERDLFGCNGGYATVLSSKTAKAPCPVCGDAIVRQAYLGGNVYYCPSCQPVR